MFGVYVGCVSRTHYFLIVVKHECKNGSSVSSFSCPCHVHSLLGDVLGPSECLQTNTLAAFISTLSHSIWLFFPFLPWSVLGCWSIYLATFFNMQLLAALEVVVKSLLFTLSPIHSYCLVLKCNYVSALEIPRISKGKKRDDTIATLIK